MPFTFRDAIPSDTATIADIHTKSWQYFYSNIMSDEYLEKEAPKERLAFWKERFEVPNAKQKIILVEQEGTACGFVCAYLNHDEKYGSLIDNLHVLKEWQGHRLGKQLMQKAANWVLSQQMNSLFHLWVYADNEGAIQFYEYLGGKKVEEQLYTGVDGSQALAYRMLWEQPKVLLS